MVWAGRGDAAQHRNKKNEPLFLLRTVSPHPLSLRRTPRPAPPSSPHPHPQRTPRGDPSADFALATFFPAPLAPAVERASDVVSRLVGLAAAAPTVLSAEALGGPALSEEAARRR